MATDNTLVRRQHEPKPLPYAYDALEGISEQTTRWHHDEVYASCVEKRNEIERKLQTADRSTANPRHSEFAHLKRDESAITNAVHLHQLYYDSMGGNGDPADTAILDRIRDDFGSLEAWQDDFGACARAAGAWAVLAWDSLADRLRNYTAGADGTGVWGAIPLMVIDVAEHAYFYDHGPKRGKYIEAFADCLNWKAVDARYQAAVGE